MNSDLIKLEAITPETESLLIGIIGEKIASQETNSFGNTKGRSAILRYGYAYGVEQEFVCDVPDWIVNNCYPLLLPFVPDSVSINKYLPGQGISKHIDSTDFADPILILSLGSSATMILRGPGKPIHLFVPQRSLITLTGDLRSVWSHEITTEKADVDDKAVYHFRQTRYSIVFRKRLLK